MPAENKKKLTEVKVVTASGQHNRKGQEVPEAASGEKAVSYDEGDSGFLPHDLFGVMFLLVMPAFPIRGVRQQQDVAGCRP